LDKEVYLNHYRSICSEITSQELSYIAQALTVSKLKSKTYYLEQGQIQKSIGFISEGLIRSFYVDENPSFIRQIPAKFYFQCIEPCVIVNLPFEDMQEGYSKYKNIERYGRLITEEVLVMQQLRLESFLFQNGEQRYVNFMSNYPTLFNRVSLTDLATYLGIERQSLSRIRKSLTQK
jgi:CRP/FNR family transcriptional regulator, anaerobic regulatory protein